MINEIEKIKNPIKIIITPTIIPNNLTLLFISFPSTIIFSSSILGLKPRINQP